MTTTEKIKLTVLTRVPEWLMRMISDQPPVRDMRRVASANSMGDTVEFFDCSFETVLAKDVTFPGENAAMAEKAQLRALAIGRLSDALGKCDASGAIAIRSVVSLSGTEADHCAVYTSAVHYDDVARDWPLATVEEEIESEPEPVVPASEPLAELIAEPIADPIDLTPPIEDDAADHDDEPEWLRAPPAPLVELSEAQTVFKEGDKTVYAVPGVLNPECLRYMATAKLSWPRKATVSTRHRSTFAAFELTRNGHVLIEHRIVDLASVRMQSADTACYALIPSNSRLYRDVRKGRSAWSVRSRERMRWMQRR